MQRKKKSQKLKREIKMNENEEVINRKEVIRNSE